MRRSDSELLEAYKARIWEYAELHRNDPEGYPWKVAQIRRYIGCSLETLHRHTDLRDLFWNVRRILNM